MTSKAKLKKILRFFQVPRSFEKRFGNKLFLEHLESREVMNRATWISTADGDWGNAANWDIRDANNNVVVGVPTINDDVIIDLANNNPVITVSTNAVAKTVLSTEKISVNAGLLQISNASTIAGNVEIKNNGTLQTDSQLTLSGTVDWIQGTITDTGTSIVTISGNTNLTGTATISGTTLTNLGTLNISSGGALTFSNGTLVNESTGTIDIQNDNSFTATNSTLQNKGLLKKSSGSNTVTLPSGLNLDNTGSVEVYSGTFKVTTTSQISTDQITNIKTLTAGKWKAVNGTLDLAASNSITINQGELTFGLGGAITGTESLNRNDGVLRLLDGVNRGFVNFVNQSSGLIEFSGNSSPVIGGSFTNNGVIKKTGLGTSYIFGGYSFYNNGTIQADSGNLKLGRSSDPNDTTHYYGEWKSSILNASAGATVDIYGNYNFNNTSTAIPTLSGSGSGIIRQQGRFAIAGGPSVTVNFADGLYQMDGGEIRGANSTSRFINTGFISVGANSGNFYQVLNQGNIVVDSVAVTTNIVINDTQGIIELSGNSSLVSGGNDGVTNDGTIKKTGSGTSYIFGGSGFNNNGTIQADSGTLKLGQNLSSSDTTRYGGYWTSPTLTAAAGAAIDIYGNYYFNTVSGGMLTGSGSGIVRQQGRLGIWSGPSVNLNLATGLYQMDGGEIRGANSTSRFINTGFISVGANSGNFYQVLNQGNIVVDSVAVTTNIVINDTQGIIELAGNSSLVSVGNDGVTNSGIIKKTGVGTSYIFGGSGLINNGTIRAESGTLQLGSNTINEARGDWSSTSFQVLSGAIIDLTGSYYLRQGTFSGSGSGTVKLRGTLQVPNFGTIQSSTLQFPDGMFLIDGGLIQGAGSPYQIANTGSITIGANGGTLYRLLNQGNILVNSVAVTANLVTNDTQGIIELAGNSSLVSGGNDGVTNSGIIKKTGSGTSYIFGGSGLINNGTIRAESGTLQLGSNTINESRGDWSSTNFQVLSGAIIDITGSYYLRQGTFSGSGSGTVKLRGTLQVPNFGTIQSSTLQFPDGMFLIDGGLIQGAGSPYQIANTGSITIGANGGNFYFFINQGNIQTGSASFALSAFENGPTGTITLTSTGGITAYGGNASFTNRGTIRKIGASTVTISGLNNFNQENARMILEGGNLVLYFTINGLEWNNVSFEFSNNATIENQRATTIRGVITGRGQGAYISKDNLNGSYLGAATLDFAPGAFVLDNSNLQPDNSTGITNIGEIQAAGTSRITSSNFLNSGTIKLQNGASLSFPVIKNISTSGSINTLLGGKWVVGNGASFVVDNSPNIQVNKADVILTGTGSFNALASAYSNYGSLTLVDKNYWLPSGFENLGTLTVQNTNSQFANLKTLGAGQFINKGTFVLGPNTALSAGSFEQNSVGLTELQIQGSPSSGLYGRISTTGVFTENGELAIKLLQGFGPTQGDTYPILNYASKTGSFSSVTGLTSGSLTLFQFNQGTTSSSLFAPASATDLKVTNISQTFGSVAANSQQTFTWTVLNDGGINASSSLIWKDTVYLSSDRVIDNEDIVLGTVEHTGGLAAGQTYTQSLLANVPYFVGDMHVLVATDIQKKIADVNRANNVLASNQTIYTTLPSITVGTPANSQSLDASGFKLYEVTLPGNEDIRFALEVGNTGGDAGEIYIRQGAIPFADAGRTDQEFSSGVKPSLVIPNASAGKWYVLVRGNANSTFNISASIVPFGIQTVSSNRGANSGKNTVFITGAAFDSTTTVQLTSNSTVIATGTVYVVDRNHISVEFDLTGKPLGTYDIKATKGGLVSTKAGAFDIVSGNPGRMEIETIAPSYIRSNRVVPITIRYSNPGDTQTEARLIKVHSDNGKFRLPGSGDNAWSEYGLVLFAYNQDGKPSILPAGSINEIKLEFMPISNGDHVFSTIVTEEYDDAQPKDYVQMKEQLKPLGVSQTAWNLTVDNLQARMGNTVGSWNEIFRQDADYFASIGQKDFQYFDLYGYETRLASNNGSLFTQYKDGALGKAMPDPTKFEIEKLRNDLFVVYMTSENPIYLQVSGFYGLGTAFPEVEFRVLGDDSLTAVGFFDSSINNSGNFLWFLDTQKLSNNVTARYKNASFSFNNGLISGGSWYNATKDSVPVGKIGEISSIESFSPNRFSPTGTMTFTRDANHQVTRISTNDGYASNYQYNSAGKITSETDFLGSITTYTYDSTNNHIASITNDSGTTSYTWNGTQGTNQSNLLVSETDELGFQRTYARDSLGKVTSITVSRGTLSRTTNYAYLQPSVLQITEPDGRITMNYLGIDGTIAKSISASGNVLDIVTDGNSVTEYLNGSFITDKNRNYLDNTVTFKNPLNNNFEYSYNDKNFLSSLKEFSGATTQFIYGNNDFLSSTIYPDGTRETVVTNDQGQATAFTNRSGDSLFISYDSNGRISQKTYADGTVVSYTYDSQDRYNTISSNGQTITYTYSGDNVSKVDYGGGKYVEYRYNPQGFRSRISTSSGLVQTYQYDDFLRLTAIRDGSGNLQAQYTYNNRNLIARTDHANGSYSLYTYNSDNITTRIEHFKSDGTLLTRIDYQVDGFGRITSRTIIEGANAPQTTQYLYTANNQINQVTLPDGSTIGYVYDANGNRVRTFRNGSISEESAFNILNQETSSNTESFLYDADGARIRRTGSNGITDYIYNSLDQLVEVHSGTDVWKYEYDPLGNRKAVIKNGVRTDYIVDPFGTGNGGANVISQSTGSSTSHFYYGSILESEFDGSNTYSFNYDSIGNTVLVSDGGQNVVNRYQYLPFGEVSSSSGTRQNAFQFSGAYGVQNDGNGLTFMRARYYDPTNGTFTQADPIGFKGSPSNLYLYAANNPLSLADPTGLTPCPPDNNQNGAPPNPNIVEQVVYSPEYGVFSKYISYANYFASLIGGISTGINELGAFKMNQFCRGIRASLDLKGINESIRLLSENLRRVDFKSTGLLTNSKLAELTGCINLFEKQLSNHLISLGTAYEKAGTAFQNVGKVTNAIGYLSAVNDLYSAARDWDKNNAEGQPWYFSNNLHNVAANINNAIGIWGPPPAKAVSAVINALDYATNPDGFNVFGRLNELRGGSLFGTSEQDVLVRRDGYSPDETLRRIKERDCAHLEQRNPNDPNDIIGPTGFGLGNSIELSDMAYRVRFENKSNASAPAAEVFVTEVLDTDLDISTFRFTGAGFGSQSVTFNTPLKSVYARVDDRANSGLFVDITGNLNTSTRTINWVFRSIDPTTLQVPADATVGFLPPNTTSPMGEGYLTYTVRPNANSANGTVIDALASIIFDGQQTINTPLYTNTIDIAAPTSTMNALGATQTSTTFNISWTGTDDAGQSGIEGYDIYVSDNGGPYNIFLADTTNTTASFTGVNGHTYRFKSVAYDNLGFVQALPANAQTTTTIQVPSSGGGGGGGGGSSGGGGGGGGSGGGSSTPNLPTTLVVATGNTISIVNSDGTRRNITGEFANGTRARLAVTDNSSTYSIVTAPPRNGDPVLDILDLSTGKSQKRIQVFDNAFRGGISMDTADIDGDGIYEFLVGAGPTGGPHVKLLRADGSEMLSFFAFDATFTGGTSVAFADVDGNGTKEIVVGAGPGGGPHVKIFQLDGTLLRSFFAFDPGFTGGVFLAAGDLGGDNAQEIVVGAGAGGGPVVKIFDGNSLQVRGEFFAYDSAFLGGVMVALQDYNLDGRLDLVTGAGKGGSPHVKVFDGPSLNLIDQFFAGDPALTEGAFV